jgi:TPR repeat protein
MSCAFLVICVTAAFAQGLPSDTQSLSADRAAQRDARARAELQSARQAVAQEDWPRALHEWQNLSLAGNSEAPAQLCRMSFDGRQGTFDIAQTTSWCRQAAGMHDPSALYRMGLFYLIGLGVDANLDQARALCAAARNVGHDPDVATGFCLAVVTQEKARAAHEAFRKVPAARPAASPAQPVVQSPQQRCVTLFAADAVSFDAAETIKWCGQAAAAGDAAALYRLGLMKMMGLGGPRDLAQAESDCSSAQAGGGGHLSAAFCLAAVAELQRATESLALGRALGDIDTNPTTGLSLPKTEVDPYLADRLLDAPHRSATGLDYTCRQFQDWARYDAPGLVILTPRDRLFGRKIVDYRPIDFASLDDAAADCMKTVAAADAGGGLRRDFIAFRESLGTLAARRAGLLAEESRRRSETQKIELEERARKVNVVILPSIVTPQEGACFEEVRRAWVARSVKENTALEINDSRRALENGNYVVRGHARTIETDDERRDAKEYATFSCAFKGESSEIATSALLPDARPRRQSVDGIR